MSMTTWVLRAARGPAAIVALAAIACLVLPETAAAQFGNPYGGGGNFGNPYGGGNQFNRPGGNQFGNQLGNQLGQQNNANPNNPNNIVGRQATRGRYFYNSNITGAAIVDSPLRPINNFGQQQGLNPFSGNAGSTDQRYPAIYGYAAKQPLTGQPVGNMNQQQGQQQGYNPYGGGGGQFGNPYGGFGGGFGGGGFGGRPFGF